VGYLPNVQPTWLEGILESPDGEVVVQKGLHQLSASDSVTFLVCLEHVLICVCFVINSITYTESSMMLL
jgi:hypothetical protein